MKNVMRKAAASCVAAGALLAIVLGAPAASAAPSDVTVPGVSTPAVTVPSVSTPSETVHVPSLPSLPPVHAGGSAGGSVGVG